MSEEGRLERTNVLGLLASTGFFSVFDEATLKAVQSSLEPVQIPGGEILIRQGEPGDSLYILVHGRLQVTIRNDKGKEEVVGEVARGEIVGEMAVLTGEPRSATARAIRDSELVRFSKDAFERVIGSNPAAMMMVARQLVSRLKIAMQPYPKTRLNTIAVISIDSGLDLTDFSSRLAAGFAKSGSTVHLNRRLLRQEFGDEAGSMKSGAIHPGIRTWLDARESAHKFALYEADPEFTPWTSHCIRQADRILLIARAGARPEIGRSGEAIERLCTAPGAARKTLVLLHPNAAARAADCKKWLDAVPARDAHSNLHDCTQSDYDRLARLLTGEAVGVVLGGGGARGLAHIGVLRALEESGVPIDAIGGTSMGSVIAAQYALGLRGDELMEINRKGWVDLDPFKDKTIPIMAVLACKKLDRMLAMMFGDARIEDLWLKFFCVSANLTQASMNVHTEGPLMRAVRSSLAIPGVAIPVFDRGDLIVDGGVLNNLPGDVMGKICGGSVIVVDVSAQKDLSIDPSMIKPPSPWRILWSRINPLGSAIDAPNILAIMMRTIMIGSMHNSKMVARQADLYIRPPIDRHGMFDWKSINQIVDTGYQHGRAQIEEWKKTKKAAVGDGR
jgi:predicted acylesterase/phospholipase RssA/CRP-like cAMP-binding protein